MKKTLVLMIAAAAFSLTSQTAMANGSAGADLFGKKCKMCHKIDKDTTGPGVKNMKSDRDALINIITNGSPNKKIMKAWGDTFSADEIGSLADYILQVQKGE